MKSVEFSDALNSGQLTGEFQYLLDKNPIGIIFLIRIMRSHIPMNRWSLTF
ncbi:MAG: hypothetical protein SCL54_06695 [Bacillota bacterium]|nr:hypothetical protein [Bacillota bacterium]